MRMNLNRPKPFSDESIRGYIIRLAHANGINAQKENKKINMVDGTAIKNILMVTQKSDIGYLSAITNIKESTLRKMCLYDYLDKYEKVDVQLLRAVAGFGICRNHQICPEC